MLLAEVGEGLPEGAAPGIDHQHAGHVGPEAPLSVVEAHVSRVEPEREVGEEADGRIAAGAQEFFAGLAAERKLLTVPADRDQARKLASRYANPLLGEVAVLREGGRTRFDLGGFSSDMASRVNPDGTVSFVTIVPGLEGLEFVVAERTLTLRDAQHEYVFAAR